jgi:TRAP-type C4-dicarboxylate transport system permease small subunit
LLIAAFLVLALLPMIDFVARPLGRFHVPGSASYVQLLTFFLTFLGGLAATASDQHLKLSTAVLLGDGRLRRAADFLASTAAATVSAVLAFAAVNVVLADRMLGGACAFGAPEWLGEAVMPASLAVMALVYFTKSWRSWRGRAVAERWRWASSPLASLPRRHATPFGPGSGVDRGDACRFAGFRCDGRPRRALLLPRRHPRLGRHGRSTA